MTKTWRGICWCAVVALGFQTHVARAEFAANRTALFEEFKSIESASHLARIRILQEAESCIQSATDRPQYRACEEREQAARERVQQTSRERHEQLRARVEQWRGGREGMALR